MDVYETDADGLVRPPAYVVDSFSPDQPRDKDGKWGAGGDVAAASKAKAAGHEALAEHHFEQHALKASVGEQLQAKLSEKGGATIDPSKSGQKANVRKGFAVSTELEHERQVPLKDWTPQTAVQYAKDKAEVLSKPGNKIGSWVDKGTVFYDVSTVVDTAEKAAELGRAHKQLGFFDLEKKQTVRLMKKRDAVDALVTNADGVLKPACQDGLDGFPVIGYGLPMEFTTRADGLLGAHEKHLRDRPRGPDGSLILPGDDDPGVEEQARRRIEVNNPETFTQARDRHLGALKSQGWDVKTRGPQGALKTPHATSPDGRSRLWFKTQSAHLSSTGRGESHSMASAHSVESDIRNVQTESLTRGLDHP